MKKIAKSILLIALVGIVLIGSQSCKKYPNNSLVNLESRTSRISNTWQVDNYKIDGVDLTSLVADYTETYTKSGGYSYSWGMIDGQGTWTFQNKDTEVLITGIKNQSTTTLYIQKLDADEFWYYTLEDGTKKEYHLRHN